jgi:hypothetical protein
MPLALDMTTRVLYDTRTPELEYLQGGITMADSLLHALLLDSRIGFTENDWLALDAVKKRLLLSELYEALNRDPQIMPLLVTAILQRNANPPNNAVQALQTLFTALVNRIRADHQRFP